MMLLGLAGVARSGKDTIASHLEAKYSFHRYAFADPLKEGLATMLEIPTDELFADEVKEQPIEWLGRSPRFLAQTLGTEWGRDTVHHELWLRIAERRLAKWEKVFGHPTMGVVISDVRFDNEAQWIRKRGGMILHVKRPGHESGVPDHPSECGVSMLPSDVVVTNDADIEALKSKVDYIIRGLIAIQAKNSA